MKPRSVLLFVLLAFAGCGHTTTGSHSNAPVKAAPFVCHHRVPAQAGECIAQELKERGVGLTVTAPRVGQCVDISVWQGIPNLRAAGVRCVIIQTNDGGIRNRLFYDQVAAAKRAGIPWGVYTFIAPGESGADQANIALAMSNGRGRTLGVWADAEVPGAYQQACPYTAHARSLRVHVYGVYSSPGLWPGYRCAGYIWPAEWGGGAAYPLGGYPQAAVILRQSCGTCRLAGFSGEVDRDEDRGLLALSHAAPSKAQRLAAEHRQLERDYKFRRHLQALLTKRRCRTSSPTRGYAHTCHVWLAQGAAVNRAITHIHFTYHIY